MAIYLISLAVFVGVVCIVVAISYVMGDIKEGSKTEERLRSLTGKGDDGEQASITKEAINDSLTGVRGCLRKWDPGLPGSPCCLNKPMRRFEMICFCRSRLPVRHSVYSLPLSAMHRSLLPVAALMFGLLPLIWIMMKRRKRFKMFAQQLPDALELVARALRSGHSLASGLHVVIEEMPDPISVEFSKAYEEQNLGFPWRKHSRIC
ncbi:MAG: hypothetical protein R3C11_03365 [Planctomycetaceae bacterium]